MPGRFKAPLHTLQAGNPALGRWPRCSYTPLSCLSCTHHQSRFDNGQVALHVGITARMQPIIDLSTRHGMAIMAYSPLALKLSASDELVRADGVTATIGRTHSRSGAEVALRYIVQRGVCVISQTTSPSHLQSNLGILGWQLTDADMAALDARMTPYSGGDQLFASKRCFDFSQFMTADTRDALA